MRKNVVFVVLQILSVSLVYLAGGERRMRLRGVDLNNLFNRLVRLDFRVLLPKDVLFLFLGEFHCSK